MEALQNFITSVLKIFGEYGEFKGIALGALFIVIIIAFILRDSKRKFFLFVIGILVMLFAIVFLFFPKKSDDKLQTIIVQNAIGQPLSGVTINLNGKQIAVTDETGAAVFKLKSNPDRGEEIEILPGSSGYCPAKLPINASQPTALTIKLARTGFNPHDSEARGNIKWVIIVDAGAFSRYIGFRSSGQSVYDAVLSAQRHNPHSQSTIRAYGKAWTEQYVDELLNPGSYPPGC